MLKPTLEEVREVARRENVMPVYREVVADLETPVSAYLKVARGEYSFLLESVEGGAAGPVFVHRHSLLVLRTGDNADAGEVAGDPLVHIEEELRRNRP